MTNNYQESCDYLSALFSEVGGYEFYKELFPDNENSGEHHTDYSHPNAIYLYRDKSDTERKTLRRRVMLNDTWEQDYMEFVECNSMTLCSGLSYRRRANKLENAQRMNALIFDLDGVGLKELYNLFFRFGGEPEKLRRLPMPTFLVVSGSGLHIYYVFDEPIDLFPNIKIQLKALKYDLTFRIWEYKATSQVKEIQYQSINQGFRMVGSTNDKHNVQLRAFRTGERVTLDYLNAYARHESNKVDIKKPFRPSTMPLEAAKEKYPEWYKRVVLEGNKRQIKWDINGKQGYALYEWWLRKLPEIKGGHRYFFLMCLAIYACKCEVPKAKLKEDMKEAFGALDRIENRNPDGTLDPMKPEDIESAMEAYDKEYYNFTIADIEKLTDIRIDRNKRNGRKQALHLKMTRSNIAILSEDKGKAIQGRPLGCKDKKPRKQGSGRPLGSTDKTVRAEGSGRPSGSGTAEQTVKNWQKDNPQGKKADCNRATALDAKTIRKWWNTGK